MNSCFVLLVSHCSSLNHLVLMTLLTFVLLIILLKYLVLAKSLEFPFSNKFMNWIFINIKKKSMKRNYVKCITLLLIDNDWVVCKVYQPHGNKKIAWCSSRLSIVKHYERSKKTSLNRFWIDMMCFISLFI